MPKLNKLVLSFVDDSESLSAGIITPLISYRILDSNISAIYPHAVKKLLWAGITEQLDIPRGFSLWVRRSTVFVARQNFGMSRSRSEL